MPHLSKLILTLTILTKRRYEALKKICNINAIYNIFPITSRNQVPKIHPMVTSSVSPARL